ncbi:MAG: hypothetical protein M1610_06355 [Nitrospirae bacterium]|nr:hypothetical protein [Nitrospirota bacterium]MDA8339870.1 hypothetical protein [Nitrospiraceae bacterium]
MTDIDATLVINEKIKSTGFFFFEKITTIILLAVSGQYIIHIRVVYFNLKLKNRLKDEEQNCSNGLNGSNCSLLSFSLFVLGDFPRSLPN